MPTYLLACDDDHRFEVRQPFSASLPDCTCGQPTRKLPTSFAVSGGVALPPRAERMPQTWRGTHNGNREYLGHLRRQAETRRTLEDANPELRGDRRPILAHEGRYEGAPLRAGDAAVGEGVGTPAGGSGGHGHGPATHGHGPATHTNGPAAPGHGPAAPATEA